MANELKLAANPASQIGLTVVARVYDGLGVKVGLDVACVEVAGLAIYLGDMPTAPKGRYLVRFFTMLGDFLSQNFMEWDGDQEVTAMDGPAMSGGVTPPLQRLGSVVNG